MKPYVRIKNIKGHEYVYEITPYYDPVTQNSRQKSRYLGKNVEGVPVKVRGAAYTPKKILSYGEFLPLKKIIGTLGIDQILSTLFPKPQDSLLLTLAMNYVVRPRAFMHVQNWYEGTILSEDYPDLPLSSQNLSKILSGIGESTYHLEFSKEFIRRISTSKSLVYDITSLSSYSQIIKLLEYGYNRGGLNLLQINLSLIVDRKQGIPVMYDLYPGSIVDVSTIRNTLIKLESLGISEYSLILDRGFFSEVNLDEMISHNLSFIIPPLMSLKCAKEEMSRIHDLIEDPDFLKSYEGEPLYAMPISLRIGEYTLQGYAYYDQNREQEMRNHFNKRLLAIKTRLESVRFKSWMKPYDILTQIAGTFERYFDCAVIEDHFVITLRKKAINQRLNRMGRYMLLYRGDFSWDECLALYRSKDIVEKGFSILKNNIEVTPMNVKKEATMRGYLFVCFLALIIRMRLQKIMKDSGLLDKWTVDGLLMELEKYRVIILPDGKRVFAEITKRQREILQALQCCA